MKGYLLPEDAPPWAHFLVESSLSAVISIVVVSIYHHYIKRKG